MVLWCFIKILHNTTKFLFFSEQLFHHDKCFCELNLNPEHWYNSVTYLLPLFIYFWFDLLKSEDRQLKKKKKLKWKSLTCPESKPVHSDYDFPGFHENLC